MSHIVVEKGGIFLERGVDSGRIAYICLKGGIFCEEGVDSVRVAYICLGGYILGRMVRFWEDRIICLKGGYNL